jgi:hypothetical protein
MLLVVTVLASCGPTEPPEAADVGIAVSGAAASQPILWPLAWLGALPAVVETWRQAEAEPE